MSSSLIIKAVTKALINLLGGAIKDPGGAELGSGKITAKPLNQARQENDKNQLNLFLYHAEPISLGTDQDDNSSLALNLYYLITAYGAEDKDTSTYELLSHELLGKAMNILQQNSTLSAKELNSVLGNTDLGHLVKPAKINQNPLSSEELNRLWSLFQTPYRLSVAYQVSAVSIDSA